jgi:hypothetical protein
MRIYDLPGLGVISAQLFAGGMQERHERGVNQRDGVQAFRVSVCGRTMPIRPVKCLAQRKIFASH